MKVSSRTGRYPWRSCQASGSSWSTRARIREARFRDVTQGKIRKRALFTTRWMFLLRCSRNQPMKRSRGAIFRQQIRSPERPGGSRRRKPGTELGLPTTACSQYIPHAGSEETFCSLRKVAAARARGARRPSGAEAGVGGALAEPQTARREPAPARAGGSREPGPEAHAQRATGWAAWRCCLRPPSARTASRRGGGSASPTSRKEQKT